MENTMLLKYRLLNHPFYESWMEGKITFMQLSRYAASYNQFIQKIPEYWEKILIEFNDNSPEGERIVADEIRHGELWSKWSNYLPIPESFPIMDDLINTLDKMNPSELLGAIHSFEIQQPEIARSKKNGLMLYYGFKEEELDYFNEHFLEEKHIEFGLRLKDKYANRDDFQKGFDNGSELIYNSLDLFLE
jgi:pyrroloquinoline quinone (PQQ) biosynthesis protein C